MERGMHRLWQQPTQSLAFGITQTNNTTVTLESELSPSWAEENPYLNVWTQWQRKVTSAELWGETNPCFEHVFASSKHTVITSDHTLLHLTTLFYFLPNCVYFWAFPLLNTLFALLNTLFSFLTTLFILPNTLWQQQGTDLSPSGGGVGHHGEVVAHVPEVLCQRDASVDGSLTSCHRHVGSVGHLQCR